MSFWEIEPGLNRGNSAARKATYEREVADLKAHSESTASRESEGPTRKVVRKRPSRPRRRGR